MFDFLLIQEIKVEAEDVINTISRIWLLVELEDHGTKERIIICNIYAPVQEKENIEFWKSLRIIQYHSIVHNMVIVGDFSETISQQERKGGSMGKYPFWKIWRI